VSESGLGLLWTGAGYFPPLNPVEGVPTYPLIFETLCKKSLASAKRYLEKINNSAPYIFFLADDKGDAFCIEATTKASKTVIHYCCPEIVKKAKQDAKKLAISYKRLAVIESATTKASYSSKEVVNILRTKGVLINNPNSSMTIGTIVADPINLTLGVIHGLEGRLKTFTL
jgi:hypothetical protein